MAKASAGTVANATMEAASTASTIITAEAEHFGRLAADWWDPHGSSAMLHRLGPARLGYIRARINGHWGVDAQARQPLLGRRVLDVGCGAGLLTEPLCRLGGDVTGVDAAAENVAVAQEHSAAGGLSIAYVAGDIAGLDLGRFDLITSMEVIEHVADPAVFLAALAQRLADGGMMILSTPNRTAASRLLLVEGAERIGMVPRGTHDWDKFLTPEELTTLAENAGLRVVDVTGLSPDLRTRGFQAGGSQTLNYLMTLVAS